MYSPLSSNEYIVLLRNAIVIPTKIVIRATEAKAAVDARKAPEIIASRTNKPSTEAPNRRGCSDDGIFTVNLSTSFENSI